MIYNNTDGRETMSPLPKGPLVSVGIPAYSSSHLRQALESIVRQNYGNLEIIVSDDCSADEKVGKIAKEFAALDSRVQYHRQEKNLGEVANSNFVFAKASGEFFMWGSDNDVWDQEFVRSCLEVLQKDSQVVLCYAQAQLIDEEGNSHGIDRGDCIDTQGLNILDRVKRVLWRLSRCTAFHGLIRSEALKRTQLCQAVWGADHLLLAELSLEGSFVQIPRPFFYRRVFQESYEATNRRHTQLIYRKGKVNYPFVNMTIEHLRMLARSSRLNYVQRGRLMLSVLSAFNARFGKIMRRELIRG